jgi:GT2 family glycosyltransferase
MYLQQRRYVEKRRFAATANLFTLKSVIDDVGPFDSVTYNLSACEDTDWGWRVFARGYKQIYSEEARVRHPARQGLSELCKKMIRTIEGRASFENKWMVSKQFDKRCLVWLDNIGWSFNRAGLIIKEPGLKGRRAGLLFLAIFLLIVRLMTILRLSMLKYKKV